MLAYKRRCGQSNKHEAISRFCSRRPDICWVACRNRQLGLILLKEAKDGSESKFKLYIESLPREVQTLINWSHKELQQLQMDSTPTEKDFLTQVVILFQLALILLSSIFGTSPCKRVTIY